MATAMSSSIDSGIHSDTAAIVVIVGVIVVIVGVIAIIQACFVGEFGDVFTVKIIGSCRPLPTLPLSAQTFDFSNRLTEMTSDPVRLLRSGWVKLTKRHNWSLQHGLKKVTTAEGLASL